MAVTVAGKGTDSADRYAQPAVQQLRQALAKQFKDVAKFKKDPAFDAIRSRGALQKQLSIVNAKPK